MKKIGQLMKDIGFNTEAPDSAKEAFLKYLFKQGAGVNIQTPTEKKAIQENPHKIIQFPVQLSFDFDEQYKQTKVKS